MLPNKKRAETNVSFNHSSESPSIDVGDFVYIFRVGLFQRPFLEGRAKVIAPVVDEPGDFWVQFGGEISHRQRSVERGLAQNNPEAHLKNLLWHWREMVPADIRAEFYDDGQLVRLQERRGVTPVPNSGANCQNEDWPKRWFLPESDSYGYDKD